MSIEKRLDQVELLPFRAAIEPAEIDHDRTSRSACSRSGARARTARDSGENPLRKPSHRKCRRTDDAGDNLEEMVAGLLRHDLKFDGLVVSDAMDMAASPSISAPARRRSAQSKRDRIRFSCRRMSMPPLPR